jgi:multiple antibiotic resistance protein
MEEADTFWMQVVLIASIAIVYLLTFIILRAATRINKIIGETGNNVMMRLMGLILMVIAIEFFVSGIKPILIDILRQAPIQ